MKEKLIYINELGKSVEISHTSLFFLESVEGLGAIKNIIYTQKSPNQDGVTEVGDSLEPRDINIEGSINSTNKEEILKHRRTLIQVFNPKLKGKLRYQLGSFIKEVNCKVEYAPIFPSVESKFKKFLIQLYCPNPFWLDDFETSEEITTWVGGMRFPLRLPTKFAMAGAKIINIVNKGDAETPIKLEIIGPATNPKILNKTTGEYIKVNRTLSNEDILTITTDFGNKRVEQNGVSVFNYIDLSSTFFNLGVGDNVIELTTDDVNDNAKIKISYYNRYLGV